MKRVPFARTVAAVATLVAAPVVQAYAVASTHWNPTSLPIPYGINLATAPPSIGSSGAQTAIEGAFATWSGPACTVWRAMDQGNTTRVANTGDSLNTILWISGSWPAELGDVNTTIGITTPVWEVGGYFIDADIQFNNVGFTWSTDGATNTVDTQSIATHEEGHFLGMDHSTVASAIMYASYSGGIKRTLDPDDQMGVCSLYPSGTTSMGTDAGMMMTTTGTGTTGSPCTANTDCSSGTCANDGTHSFCTNACTTDCACPSGYTCYTAYNLCGPGANACSAPHDAGSTTMGTGTDGTPCTSGTQCATGTCVTATGSGFCSRLCTDDCTCSAGYECYPTTTAGRSVCAPGTTRHCATDSDAGLTVVDSGPLRAVDGGSTVGNDGATVADAAGDNENGGTHSGSCGCSTPGRSRRGTSLGALLAVGAIAAGTRRRRR